MELRNPQDHFRENSWQKMLSIGICFISKCSYGDLVLYNNEKFHQSCSELFGVVKKSLSMNCVQELQNEIIVFSIYLVPLKRKPISCHGTVSE